VKIKPTTTTKKLKEIQKNVQKLWDNYKRHNIHAMGISEGDERKKGIEEILEIKMAQKFPQINTEHQTTDLERSESTK
jgi:hypothetical protein